MDFIVTKRINKIYKMLIILLIISLAFTSCTFTPLFDQNTSEGFEKGLEYEKYWLPNGTPPALRDNLFCACKSNKSEFNINFVILDFYYGGDFSEDLEYEKKHYSDYPSFDLFFKDDDGNEFFVKRVNENFVSEKYRCKRIEYDFTIVTEFSHSEKLWVPRTLFTKDSGLIYFSIYGENQRYSDPRYECITSMSICYKLSGNKVILSAQEIK